MRRNGGSRFGWVDGFDGWISGELRLFFHKGLPCLLLRRGRQIARRCDRWLLTNRLLYAAAIRFSAARRPCTSLLDMLNVRRIFWCRFGTRFTAQLCKRWLFADRRQYALRHIVRKSSFRQSCMKMISRRRLFCAGFLCLLHIRASLLFLRRGCRYALRLFRLWPGAHIVCALSRRIFYRWRGHCGMLRLLRRDRLRWRGRFCGLLNISTSGLFLRCGYRCALRRRCI